MTLTGPVACAAAGTTIRRARASGSRERAR